jgi:hypothetical protein
VISTRRGGRRAEEKAAQERRRLEEKEAQEKTLSSWRGGKKKEKKGAAQERRRGWVSWSREERRKSSRKTQTVCFFLLSEMGCSNVLTGVLNFVTLVLSIPVVGVGIWLAKQHNTVCVRFLQWPIILLGVFILAVSVAGLLGAWCRVSCLLWVYLFVMFVLILLLFVFTIFAFAVTNAGAGQVLSGKGYKEYRLGDYSTWLQRKVNNPSYWETIKSCLSDGKVCNSLDAPQYSTIAQFNAAPLSPIQVLGTIAVSVVVPSFLCPHPKGLVFRV